MTGTALSQAQDRLARLWQSDGPAAVATVLDDESRNMAYLIAMANIGARAQQLADEA